MNSKSWVMSAESHSKTHPDKACDLISDTIADFFVERDPGAIICADTMMTDKLLSISGDFHASQDAVEEARSVLPYALRDLACSLYPMPRGFDWPNAKKALEFKPIAGSKLAMCKHIGGWVDQGLVFGYACDETEELMPMPIAIANRLSKRLDEMKSMGQMPMQSEATVQVNAKYSGGVPKSLESVVFTVQQAPGADRARLEEKIMELVVKPSLAAHMLDGCSTRVNIAGEITWGGIADGAGISGRRSSSDTYGGACPFYAALSGRSGNCSSRAGSYMARAIAKALVKSGATSRAQVSLAYASGMAQPVNLSMDFFNCGLGDLTERDACLALREGFDLSLRGISEFLDLGKPIFAQVSCHGHFGREKAGLSWEDEGCDRLTAFFENLSN